VPEPEAKPIAIITPDPRHRFSLAKLVKKVPSYEVFPTERGGVRIEPIYPEGEQR
jgi:hypothetical protein